MDEELQKAIALLESNGYVVTKPMMNEMTEHRGFKSDVVYKVRQKRKSYDALCLGGSNGKVSFVLGDNSLDSDFPLTINGKPMSIISTKVCVSTRLINKWNKATNKTAGMYEIIHFQVING